MKPRLLDLFCGAGGAAMGYHRAGFEVVGVDIAPQPNYPFEFIQDDAMRALQWMGEGLAEGFDECFDAIHASPPCQHYSRATAWRGDRDSHPDLIAPVRQRLKTLGLPYVIENVQEARRLLETPLMLCGTMFGLQFQRHRYFEIQPSWLVLTPSCRHQPDDYSHDHGSKQPESVYREALGCSWMTVNESREAIPPAYTEFIGRQLLEQMRGAA